jgi:hypothetical protein
MSPAPSIPRCPLHTPLPSGTGSYERVCTTLYVHYGGAGSMAGERLRVLMKENFGEWGPIDDIYIVPAKTIAFVRYNWRSSAEFAKAAMHQQTLTGACLILRVCVVRAWCVCGACVVRV